MTYIEDINTINEVKDKIASDIDSFDLVDFFGHKYFLYEHTYGIHKVGKKLDSVGKKRYRPYDCVNPGTSKYFNKEEARKFVSFLINRYKFVLNEEDLNGKKGWFSQDEDGWPRAYIYFQRSKKEKHKSLYIKFNVQYIENNPRLGNRSHFIVNMLSFHPSYNITNDQEDE
tara:strand:+ start:43 stop:555 length:513 start_codon:yes stop_codon:yes gene_type:complete